MICRLNVFRRTLLGGLVPVLYWGLALSGCGLKTYPKPMSGGPIPPSGFKDSGPGESGRSGLVVPNELSEALRILLPIGGGEG